MGCLFGMDFIRTIISPFIPHHILIIEKLWGQSPYAVRNGSAERRLVSSAGRFGVWDNALA